MQRYVGYCMTRQIREHVFVFAYGPGANGKGVFLNTIVKVFGEYAVVADMATFIDSHNDRHPSTVRARTRDGYNRRRVLRVRLMLLVVSSILCGAFRITVTDLSCDRRAPGDHCQQQHQQARPARPAGAVAMTPGTMLNASRGIGGKPRWRCVRPPC